MTSVVRGAVLVMVVIVLSFKNRGFDVLFLPSLVMGQRERAVILGVSSSSKSVVWREKRMFSGKKRGIACPETAVVAKSAVGDAE